MNIILAIASGGAVGAVLRYFVGVISLKFMGAGFPYGTLAVNVMGSFMMGVLIAYFAYHWNPSAEVRAFLTVGLLGAFTTFSTFSLDVITLWERGEVTLSVIYAGTSVVFSILALFLGMLLIRQVLA